MYGVYSALPAAQKVNSSLQGLFYDLSHIREKGRGPHNTVMKAGVPQFTYKVLFDAGDLQMLKISCFNKSHIDKLLHPGLHGPLQDIAVTSIINFFKRDRFTGPGARHPQC